MKREIGTPILFATDQVGESVQSLGAWHPKLGPGTKIRGPELIEPALYFRFAPEGATRFANALYQRRLN